MSEARDDALGLVAGSSVRGELRVPGSKSLAQRLLVAASLSGEETRLTGLPDGDDVRAARGVARSVAATLRELAPSAVSVVGVPPGPHRGWDPTEPLDVGESGTLARLALAALAFTGRAGRRFELAPRGTLARRSSPALVTSLSQCGVGLEARDGGDPRATFELCVRPIGPPSRVEIAHLRSSQEVSALLVALAAFPDAIELVVHGAIPSRPYLDMTLALLSRFSVSVVCARGPDTETFEVRGPLRPGTAPWTVEPDASSAAVALAAACLSGGELRVPGLARTSVQGDARVVDLLAAFGCEAGFDERGVFARGAPVRGCELDLASTPDLAPVLAAVAAAAAAHTGARTLLIGLDTLPGKESSRIDVLAEGFGRAGFAIDAGSDRLAIGPPRGALEVRELLLDPHGDHRMAFAFALLGLVRPGVYVANPGCVAKSWPAFWTDLERAGARVARRA